MEQNNLTPEQVWKKFVELNDVRESYPLGDKRFTAANDEILEFLKKVAEEPNAEVIYTFILNQKDDILWADDLEAIASVAVGKPYAQKIWQSAMNHSEFRGFDEQTEMAMLKDLTLLKEYWRQRSDLYPETEVALFSLPDYEQLLLDYFSCGHGLCFAAQKKLLTLPEMQMKKLLVKFISGIDKKNFRRHQLNQQGFFMLLKNKVIFDLYVEKMTPFLEKNAIFPPTITFVAQRKGWL